MNIASVTDDGSAPDNQVFLRGRLADPAVYRELPSGDELVTFRLTVARPPGEKVRVDSLECASLAATVRRRMRTARPGAEVRVTGSLRRRFWRSPVGPASRYTVEVGAAQVVRAARSGPRAGASPGRTRASA